ncbi:cms1 ribosomal small subunit [Dinochytrium kinnereticum]|nr:cms1 ribosomal small subunit [Dinochytrium kinnereticum]
MTSADSLEDDFILEPTPKSNKRKVEESEDDQEAANDCAKAPKNDKAKKSKFWKCFRETNFKDAEVDEFIPENMPEERSISELSSFVDSIKEDSKRIIIINPSAERAIAIIPHLKKTTKIAKLFARHMKIKDQERFLKAKDVDVYIGTPNRIAKLMDTGALPLNNVSHVIFDGSLDKKDRTIFSIPELQPDILQILKKCNSGQKVIVF